MSEQGPSVGGGRGLVTEVIETKKKGMSPLVVGAIGLLFVCALCMCVSVVTTLFSRGSSSEVVDTPEGGAEVDENEAESVRPTRTPRPSNTPLPLIEFPLTVAAGPWEFEIWRTETAKEVAEDSGTVHQADDMYLVVVGELRNKADEEFCSIALDWEIEQENGETATFKSVAADGFHDQLNLDYPGLFSGLCVAPGSGRETFLVFDVTVSGDKSLVLSPTGDEPSTVVIGTLEQLETAIAFVPSPTPSPVPTDTPEPTNTPEPTATRAPTATPDPEAVAVEEYKEWLGETVDSIVTVSSELGPLFNEFSEDTSVYADENWRRRMGIQLGLLQFIANDIDAKVPPPQHADLHEDFKEIGRELGAASVAFAEAFDNLDSDRMEEGTAHIEQASLLMRAFADRAVAELGN